MALFAQAVIQPFASRGGRRFNKCHYYTRPTPPGMLETLDNERVGLKLTLSYFIEPNPGLSASVDPQRYQSHGLRFDINAAAKRSRASSSALTLRSAMAAVRPAKGPTQIACWAKTASARARCTATYGRDLRSTCLTATRFA